MKIDKWNEDQRFYQVEYCGQVFTIEKRGRYFSIFTQKGKKIDEICNLNYAATVIKSHINKEKNGNT